MKVVVVGAGKVGYYLVKTLQEHGHTPIVIEENKKSCSRIADTLGVTSILGDGSTIETMEVADIRDAQSFVAVTGSDEVNLVACQLAKKIFNVKKTVARVNNPKNTEVMKRLGVDIPISSTDSIARQIEREVDISTIRQLMSLNHGQSSIMELTLPPNYELNGVRISDIRLPDECVIISITRDDELIIPRGKTCIYTGDVIMVLVNNEVSHKLAKALAVTL